MNSWTYTKITPPKANVEKLLELWESFGNTGLFKLQIEYEHGSLVHVYHLKNTDIKIRASSSSTNDYHLLITDDDEQITGGEFWDRIPKCYQKKLAFHLDQIL